MILIVKIWMVYFLWIILSLLNFISSSFLDSVCVAEQLCPHSCSCENGIVDCKEKSLTQIPGSMISESTVELYKNNFKLFNTIFIINEKK